MPRDGSGVYSTPVGTNGAPGATIASTPYNLNVHDVETDLNAPRPVVAGGTGAVNAHDARQNIGAEAAMQTVTNYDTQVWEAGSFQSAAGATSAPVAGHAFTGTCIGISGGSLIILEAYDADDGLTPHTRYTRNTIGGSWSAWTNTTAVISSKVSKSGDTMTGSLAISAANPAIYINKPSSAGQNVLTGGVAANGRWSVILGNGGTDDFSIVRYNDAGTVTGFPFAIERATGNTSIANLLTVTGNITAGAAIAAGTTITATGNITSTSGNLFLANGLQIGGLAGTGLFYDATTVALRGGSSGSVTLQSINGSDNYAIFTPTTISLFKPTTSTGDIITYGNMYVGNNNATTGSLIFTNAGGRYLQFTSGAFFLNGGTLNVGGDIRFGTSTIPSTGALRVGYNTAGTSGATFRPSSDPAAPLIFTNASEAWVGSVNTTATNTAFNTSSDGRLKEDLKSFDAGNIVDDTNVYDFAWKSTGERSYGIIAQQAQTVYPAAVTHDQSKDEKGTERDWWGIDYSKYVPILLQELKALRVRVAELETKLEGKPA